MWNRAVYSGPLQNYTYPKDILCGDFLRFLQHVDKNKRVHLTDIVFNKNYPPSGYDMYIVCVFGEGVDIEFIKQLDEDESKPNPILLTSQFCDTTNYKRVRVFYLENIHTLRRFFCKSDYSQLSTRTKTHGSLCRRNSHHKTIITAKLLNKFKDDLNYSFCNMQGTTTELNDFYPFLKLTKDDYDTMEWLYENPIEVQGHQWDINNFIYRDSKLIWTLESMFLSIYNAPSAYLTEKTLKSIMSGSAFILVSQQNSYKRLAGLGFESIIDLKTDDKNDDERFKELFDLIENYNFDELLARPETQDIVDYNYNYFWGTFYNHIESQNRERIEAILDYINET